MHNKLDLWQLINNSQQMLSLSRCLASAKEKINKETKQENRFTKSSLFLCLITEHLCFSLYIKTNPSWLTGGRWGFSIFTVRLQQKRGYPLWHYLDIKQQFATHKHQHECDCIGPNPIKTKKKAGAALEAKHREGQAHFIILKGYDVVYIITLDG